MAVKAASSRYYLGVEEAQEMLGIKKRKAQELVRNMRQELIDEGKLTKDYPKCKVPRSYFCEKCMIGEEAQN